MNFTENRNVVRWIIIAASFAIITLILWNTYVFFQNFKAEERTKMTNWSAAQREINKTDNLEDTFSELPLIIQQSNVSTPMILTDANDHITGYRNIAEERMQDSIVARSLLNRFKNENAPLVLKSEGEILSKLYYGNSPLLNKLKYYPLALLLIILLFGAVVYFFYRSSKIAAQNKLWSGMAKETAHQIGTPLSSLVGWAEIFKTEQVDPNYIVEMEKDISRLQTITERFSKIGSIPTLVPSDVVMATKESYDYLTARSSKLIQFSFESSSEALMVNLNHQLFSWTVENLVKNAIDAMKGKGKLHIKVLTDDKFVHIQVADTGKGIPKHLYKKIFEPGYTSKKRGWGLGLSLAKRIVEDYHKGKIKVLHSELDSGTTIQVSLKLL